MAKKSAIEKNAKRQKLVERYAAKREKLKAAAMDENLSLEERYKARLKLAELRVTPQRTACAIAAKFPAVRAVTIANLKCRGSRCASLARTVRSPAS